MRIAPLAEVKDRLSAYIDATKESAIVVTRNGKPVALLTPVVDGDDLESLLLAHDPRFLRLLEKARERVRTGQYLSSEQFWGALRRRRAQRQPRPVRTSRTRSPSAGRARRRR